MRYTFVVAFLVALLFGASAANATVNVVIDLSNQRMHVTSSSGSYDWAISSARTGYRTPNGTFGVQSMQVMHRSKLYHNSPMPHSIFFAGNYAIHGTYSTGALGTPASHGCVRISPGNAAALYRMVQAEGARITISGQPASSHAYASRHRGGHAKHYAGTSTKTPQLASQSQPQSQPPARDMFSLFTGGL